MMARHPGFERPKENGPGDAVWDRDEFIAVVSHEIRNSTQSIISWAELMCSRPASDEILSQGLEVIRRNGQLQARLLKQLLAVSRKKSGDLRLEASRVALAPALEAAVKTMKPQALAKSIDLRADLEPSAASVIGDVVQLEEVFMNLLSNAIKFTPAGGRIEVRLRCRKGTAQITVSDSGRGISPEFLPHVFDRFRQEKGNPAGHDGLGLGLAIAWHIVERHGGSIHAFSAGEGKGATFKVYFPLGSKTAAGASPPDSWTTSASDQV
jgi:signal transduction histidine kinase